MAKRILAPLILTCAILTTGGCDSDGGGIPEIIGNVGYAVLQPVGMLLPADEPMDNAWAADDGTIPAVWYPPRAYEKKWKAVIIHHSLTSKGNATVFHNYHKNGHKWKGIGYDFVIGNGKGSGDGQVEVTFRWRKQMPGAHCGGTPKNWANVDGIGICLVGDFRKTTPTARQMRSLAKLVSFLQRRYNIPKNKIYTHRDTPGYKGGTGCPANFPVARLKQML